jgi:hypothetical protein
MATNITTQDFDFESDVDSSLIVDSRIPFRLESVS